MGQTQPQGGGADPAAATGTGQGEQPQVSWWLKILTRVIAVLGGLLAVALGLFACITIHGLCIAAGLLQMLMGFIVILLEAPCCCQFVEFANKLSGFSEKRPHWQKAVFYFLIAIPPIAICFEISTFFGSGLIFVTGGLYGLMAIGTKADRNTMMHRAAQSDSGELTLVSSEHPPAYSSPPAPPPSDAVPKPI